ncbi:MAG: site-specific integrase [Trueperella sp.]|uniref:tyrosine-type recombinase/integrase n=1 Tax=Trueperella sp. TaxID=2699835 RepID=UPI0025D15C03|nr:site-specific integrase [Trueperella sp.]MCI7306178.1 site-specific integrase [Trueperella sp.]
MTTIEDYYKEQGELIALDISAKTFYNYQLAFRKRILPALGDTELTKLRRSDVKRMVKNLKARGVSDSTITDAVAALSSLLEIARDDGLIEENAARGLRRRQSYRPPANRGLTADELKMFIGRTPVPYRLPVLFLAATGLRFGEMAALRFGDFTNNYTVATIGRSVSTDHTGRLQEGDTKTHKIRVVSVPSTIAQHIRGGNRQKMCFMIEFFVGVIRESQGS